MSQGIIYPELDKPTVVSFPLRGEWVAIHTPAHRIPSHGTDGLGQRYAFDFLRTDERGGMHFHPGSMLRYCVIGVPTRSCYCWQETIYAPFDGEVVLAKDGLREGSWLHPVADVLSVVKNTVSANVKARLFGVHALDLQAYLGNHLILRHENVYALFAHLRPNSIAVSEGQVVHEGDMLGRVGHTGNSTAPHLHFQLMDSKDPFGARGIPCAFRAYEAFEHGMWEQISAGIPQRLQRIRHPG